MPPTAASGYDAATLPHAEPPSRDVVCTEHHVVFGRVDAVHIDDAALTADGRIDVLKIRPIARLGYKDYTSIDAVFQMEKRTPEDSVAPR
jgi:hypothetical protein